MGLKASCGKTYRHVLLLYNKSSNLQTRSGSNKCYISGEQLEENNIRMFLNKQQRADEEILATSSSALCGLDLGNRSIDPI